MEGYKLSIAVSGIRLRGHVGPTAEQRAAGQALTVDLQLAPASHEALVLDALDATVDYDRATALVREVVEKEECRLIERLAAIACNRLWAELRLREAVVTVRLALVDTPDAEAWARVSRRL
jgi:dihydroneopterin aldolase